VIGRYLRDRAARRSGLNAEQLAETCCARCNGPFGKDGREPVPYRFARFLDAAVCDGGCILDVVDDLAYLFRAKVPSAHLWHLGSDGEPDPLWIAAQNRARLIIWDGDARVTTRLIADPYIMPVIAQAERLGMRAAYDDTHGPDYQGAWAMLWQLAYGRNDAQGVDEVHAASDAADAVIRESFGRDDLDQLPRRARDLWCKAALGHTAAWKAVTR